MIWKVFLLVKMPCNMKCRRRLRILKSLAAPPHCFTSLLEWMCLRAPNKLDHIPVDDDVVNLSVVRQVTF